MPIKGHSFQFHHYTTARFWRAYAALSDGERDLADKQFALLQVDPRHPSLHFKPLQGGSSDELWSARVSHSIRALARREPDGFVWFWIGDHATYDRRI